MPYQTLLSGQVFTFDSVKEVLAKANEENPATSWQASPPRPRRSGSLLRWFCPTLRSMICATAPPFPTRRTRSPASFRTM